jgi:hypothetical protein
MQVIQHELFLLLVDLGHFTKNNISLSFNSSLLQLGVEENVGKDLDCFADIVLEDLGKVDSLFARCIRVPAEEGKLVLALTAVNHHCHVLSFTYK